MYVVIIGCGRMGSTLAMELSNEGHDVAIIDSSENNLMRLGMGFNGERINGVEIDREVLKMAGIKMADVFLAVTPDDNINLMASQIAKIIFNVPHVMARVYEPDKEVIYKALDIQTISATELFVEECKNKMFK